MSGATRRRASDLRRLLGSTAVGLVVLLLASMAAAQSVGGAQATGERTPPEKVPSSRMRPSRVEVTALGGWLGGAELGATEASMIQNQVPSGATTALFTTNTSIAAAATVEGRVGVRVAGGWYVETGLSYGRPSLRVDIGGDVEGAPDVTATSRLSQYVIDGGLQYRWHRRRVSPFVMGGAGYVRQLDAPRTTASTGAVYYGGGGAVARVAPARRGFWGHVALRGDARVLWLRDGVMLGEQRGPTLSVSGGVSAGW